jgi:ribosome biogenesis GTPase
MNSREATVVATFSQRMRLGFDDGGVVDARIKGKKLRPVCGDRVNAEPIAGEDDWLITRIHERRNQLTRPNMRGKVEVLAANLDLVIVVAAVAPIPDWFIVDRYLCAAENIDAEAIVVYNKTDLLEADGGNEGTATEIQGYRDIGYTAIECSAATHSNLATLAARLAGKTAIIVGQSGVGKSSLINRLAADSGQKTAAISSKSGEGRHTTVNSVMIKLPEGGVVIDSPGVRDYAPALENAEQAIHGFREIAKLGQQCRFANCKHLREPNCAVKNAVDEGSVDPRRYESYRRSLALIERLSRDNY